MSYNSVLKVALLRNTLRRNKGTCLAPNSHHQWLHSLEASEQHRDTVNGGEGHND